MNQLPILNYHGLESKNGEYSWLDEEKPYVLSASAFSNQLTYLKQHGFSTLSLSELENWLAGKRFERPVVLTFDDGHVSHYEHALPILKARHQKAIFFISPSLIGKRDYMNWFHLRKLADEGFEIGSHGLNHVPLTRLSRDKMRWELSESKRMLEKRLGIQVRSFSVPRGFFEPEIAKMAESLGYAYVFTSRFQLNPQEQNPFCLGRLVVKKALSFENFSEMLEGKLGIRKPIEWMKNIGRSFIDPEFYKLLAGWKRNLQRSSK